MCYEEIKESNQKKMETWQEEPTDEKDKKGVHNIVDTNNYQQEHVISLKNASTRWFPYEEEDTLKNLNINVKPGELIAVVGQVGSGKSSFLNVLLKELPLNSGTLQVGIVS